MMSQARQRRSHGHTRRENGRRVSPTGFALLVAVLLTPAALAGQSGERVWDVTHHCWRPAGQESCGNSWDAGTKSMRAAESGTVNTPEQPTQPEVDSPDPAKKPAGQAERAEKVSERTRKAADKLRGLMEMGGSLQGMVDKLSDVAGVPGDSGS